MKKMYMYPAIIKDDEDGGYIAVIPGFNQHGSGDTLDEVMESAKTVLDMCICEYLDEKKELPSLEECMKSISEEDKPDTAMVMVEVDTNAYARVLWVSTKCIPCCVGLLEDGDDRGITVHYGPIPTVDCIIKESIDSNIDIIALPYDVPESIKQKLIEIAGDKPVFQEVVNSEKDTDDIFGGFLRWEKLN